MSPDRFVLDTSAIFTFIEDEDGSDRVDEVLHSEQVYIPWQVLMEATYITIQEKGEAEAERRYALLKQLPVEVLWEADEPILLTAARLKAYQHLSFADAIIAAYAIQLDAVLVHKDPEYENLEGQIKQEQLPFKTV